jgi:Ribonuclease G/E
MQREKEYRRDRALKISERDKAIRSLSVTDGKRAKFIVTEMQNSTDPMGVILRYRKKGLLTPEVERDIMQMTRKP